MSFMSSVSDFMKKLMLATKMIPVIVEAIRMVEMVYGQQTGKGAIKLEVVRSTLEAAFEMYSETSMAFEEVWPVFKSMTSKFVTIFNKFGWLDDVKIINENDQDPMTKTLGIVSNMKPMVESAQRKVEQENMS